MNATYGATQVGASLRLVDVQRFVKSLPVDHLADWAEDGEEDEIRCLEFGGTSTFRTESVLALEAWQWLRTLCPSKQIWINPNPPLPRDPEKKELHVLYVGKGGVLESEVLREE